MQNTSQKIENILILRTSSLGDICHMLPFVYTLRNEYPNANISWVIGRNEAEFLQKIDGINFVIFDKKNTFKSYLKIARELKDIKFDVMFLMQVSLRANIISLFVNSKIKLGYDSARSSDLHSIFTNKKIDSSKHSHVVDVFLSFLNTINIKKEKFLYSWDISEKVTKEDFFKEHPDLKNEYFILSPCSRSKNRNWLIDRYAYVADYICDRYGINCVISSSRDKFERDFVEEIIKKMKSSPINFSGKTSLHELFTLIKNSKLLISPDSGPIHIGTCTGTPVLGLYAVTNTVRAGPYNSIDLCVDKYNIALEKFSQKKPEEANWRYKNNHKDVMSLISADEVIRQIDKFFSRGK
ncbi:MAG: hypothetical protein CMB08_00735 [Euryarchaeota archaeon]|nr:hypothetical protein [Euryarchaeota archaeon]